MWRRETNTLVKRLTFCALLALLAGCIEITGETYHYVCLVGGDTLQVAGDTSGVRCAAPDSLSKGNP